MARIPVLVLPYAPTQLSTVTTLVETTTAPITMPAMQHYASVFPLVYRSAPVTHIRRRWMSLAMCFAVGPHRFQRLTYRMSTMTTVRQILTYGIGWLPASTTTCLS